MCHTFIGRLGNQLFQYVSVIGLAWSMNRTPVFKGGMELDSALKRSIRHATRQNELETRCDKAHTVGESACCKFDERLTRLDDSKDYKVNQYLQSWKYWKPHESRVLERISFSDAIENKSSTIVRSLRKRDNSTLVGVHVRRGDLISTYSASSGYPQVDTAFITKAMDYFLKPFPDAAFVVGSDSLSWCQQNIPRTYRLHFLEGNVAAVDLRVLSSLDHAVITFGTFSWWVGYLNRGITVYMKDFVRPHTRVGSQFSLPNATDYVYPGWVPL